VPAAEYAFRIAPCAPALAGADFRSHKVYYRSTGLTHRFSRSRLAQGEQEATPDREWETMMALVEGHLNIDVMVFYVLASAILAATLYYFHHKQIE
jgi:hypothetical protein